MFKLLLNNNPEVFYSFPIVKEHQSLSNEGAAEGQWVFWCLRKAMYHNFSCIPRSCKSSTDLEIPGKVLEF